MIGAAWAAYQAILALIGIPRWLPVVGMAGLLSACGAYFYGKHVAAQACQEASLRTELATIKRDIAARDVADQVEAMLNKDIEADRQQLETQVKDYEVQLRSRPAKPDCSLSADDVGALVRVPVKRRK